MSQETIQRIGSPDDMYGMRLSIEAIIGRTPANLVRCAVDVYEPFEIGDEHRPLVELCVDAQRFNVTVMFVTPDLSWVPLIPYAREPLIVGHPNGESTVVYGT